MSIRLIDILQAGLLDGSGEPLANGTVTVYDAGTTSLRTVYQDYALGSPHLNPLTLDAEGKATAYTNKRVKLVVKNALGGAVITIDNVGTISSDITALVTNNTPVTINVKDSPYSAVGDGVADDASAIQSAINAVALLGGGTVSFPAGTYLLGSELVVPDYVMLQGVSRVGSRLLANANVMSLIHHKGSYGGARDLGLYGNGKTSVSALRVTPANESQTSTRVDQNYNHFENLYIKDCENGITLQCGPDVASADSGCWYNTFQSIHIQGCTRGIWLKDGPNASSSGCNRNKFISIRIGQTNTNVGVQIDSGGTNTFYGVDFEGIQSGVSPLATPTAVYIAAAGTYSGNNDGNRFFGCMSESCTRGLDNKNSYSEFYGCDLSPQSFTQVPVFWVGGSAGSEVPFVTPATIFQGNSQIAGYNNNEVYLPFGKLHFPATQAASTDPNTFDDYEEGTFTPTLTADGASGYAYAYREGYYTKIGKRVFFDILISMSGYSATGNTNSQITGLPFTASSTGHYGASVCIVYDNMAGFAAGERLTGQVTVNSSRIILYLSTPTDSTVLDMSGALQTNTFICASGSYEAQS